MELITEKELAKRLLVNRCTIAIWRRRGLIPAYQAAFGKSIKYDWNEVINTLKNKDLKYAPRKLD